jgi:hypothetical protein
VDLKGVVGREEGDCGVDVFIVEDLRRDGVQCAGKSSWLNDCDMLAKM